MDTREGTGRSRWDQVDSSSPVGRNLLANERTAKMLEALSSRSMDVTPVNVDLSSAVSEVSGQVAREISAMTSEISGCMERGFSFLMEGHINIARKEAEQRIAIAQSAASQRQVIAEEEMMQNEQLAMEQLIHDGIMTEQLVRAIVDSSMREEGQRLSLFLEDQEQRRSLNDRLLKQMKSTAQWSVAQQEAISKIMTLNQEAMTAQVVDAVRDVGADIIQTISDVNTSNFLQVLSRSISGNMTAADVQVFNLYTSANGLPIIKRLEDESILRAMVSISEIETSGVAAGRLLEISNQLTEDLALILGSQLDESVKTQALLYTLYVATKDDDPRQLEALALCKILGIIFYEDEAELDNSIEVIIERIKKDKEARDEKTRLEREVASAQAASEEQARELSARERVREEAKIKIEAFLPELRELIEDAYHIKVRLNEAVREVSRTLLGGQINEEKFKEAQKSEAFAEVEAIRSEWNEIERAFVESANSQKIDHYRNIFAHGEYEQALNIYNARRYRSNNLLRVVDKWKTCAMWDFTTGDALDYYR